MIQSKLLLHVLEICGIRGVGVGFLLHEIRLNARRRR